MSLPARKIEPEIIVEERVARLEANVEHIQSDVSEIKVDLRRLEGKMEARFDAMDKKFEGKLDAMDKKFEGMMDKLTALERTMRQGFEAINVGRAMDKVWALLAVATLLGVMARGFKWI
jgi:predicted nuclease with TOPRIM domain